MRTPGVKKATPWLLATALLAPGALAAQDLAVDAAVLQAFSDVALLDAPRGIHLGLTGRGLLGPLGIGLSVDRVHRGETDADGFCGFARCFPGPLEESTSLTTARAGLTFEIGSGRSVETTLGVHALVVDLSDSAENEDGERVDSHDESGTGLGATLGVRLPEVFGNVRPLVFGQLDRIGSEPCLEDVSCFFPSTRYVWAAGLGGAWTLR